jgi:elongator complex protein 3
MITNLRQVMQQKGVKCSCIRCRECRDEGISKKSFKINILEYEAAGGKEFFISADSLDGKILFGFCRLRISFLWSGVRHMAGGDGFPVQDDKYKFLNNSAIIRELHVYGELVPSGEKKKTQHSGLGQRLLKEAEKIAKQNNFKNIAVISGIGARGYYRKNGYKLKSGYMIKKLVKSS